MPASSMLWPVPSRRKRYKRRMALLLLLLLLLLFGLVNTDDVAAAHFFLPPPPPPVSFANELWPRIHFTPACYQAGGPHDIAGAIHVDGLWHVMGYCFHGHWQHSISDDLVSWRMVGPPRQFGGTGGMIVDAGGGSGSPMRVAIYAATGSARHPKHCPACPQLRNGTKATCSWKCPVEHSCSCRNSGKHADCSAPGDWSCTPESNCRFWSNASAELSVWVQDNQTAFPPSNDTNCDRVWRDGNAWYAFTAGRIGGYGGGGSKGGQENFYVNRATVLHGLRSEWERLPAPFLTNNRSVLVEGHPQRSEFVSADYFQHLSGAPSDEDGIFLYHTYGGKSNGNESAYNYGVLASGRQPQGPGSRFVPQHYGALDWSCFIPSNVTSNGLALAVSHGATQFGCCAKTGQGPAIESESGGTAAGEEAGGAAATAPAAGGVRYRRILFGWQQNGNSGGDRLGSDVRAWSNGTENTMTLPRELSWGPGGVVLQRFVPELQKLRRQRWSAPRSGLAFPVAGPGAAGSAASLLPKEASGVQLEISARLSWGGGAAPFAAVRNRGPRPRRTGSRLRFGFRVLANAAAAIDTAAAAATAAAASSGDSSSSAVAEYTEVGFELGDVEMPRDYIYVNRRRSSGGVRDADVRAGPWLNVTAATEVTLHMYVDRSIVTLIVDNVTTISVWVHPTTPRESTRVALFTEGVHHALPHVESLDVWQLATPAR